jgi:hypothetical protein
LTFTYSLTDPILRVSIGEAADFSGAKYDEDLVLYIYGSPPNEGADPLPSAV